MGFTSDLCTHCSQNSPDTYIHATWHCTPIKHFWEEVTESLSRVRGCRIPLSSSICLLGDLSTFSLDKTCNKLLLVALTIPSGSVVGGVAEGWGTHNSTTATKKKGVVRCFAVVRFSPPWSESCPLHQAQNTGHKHYKLELSRGKKTNKKKLLGLK